jgi:hypothetical protein
LDICKHAVCCFVKTLLPGEADCFKLLPLFELLAPENINHLVVKLLPYQEVLNLPDIAKD